MYLAHLPVHPEIKKKSKKISNAQELIQSDPTSCHLPRIGLAIFLVVFEDSMALVLVSELQILRLLSC